MLSLCQYRIYLLNTLVSCLCQPILQSVITWAERQVKDLLRSGMCQSNLLRTRLGTQSPWVLGSSRLCYEVRTELVRDISKSLRVLWFIRIRYNNYFWLARGLNRLTRDPLDQTLCWRISRLRHRDLMWFVMWKLRNGRRAACNHRVMNARGRLLSTKEASSFFRAY